MHNKPKLLTSGVLQIKLKNKLLKWIWKWLIISKVWSFQTGFIAVTAGSALSASSFNICFYVLMLIGISSLNAIANIYNDIHDFKRGIDKEQSKAVIERKHPSIKGSPTYTPESHLKLSMLIFFLIALACGSYIAYYRGIIILVLGLAGAAITLLYTIGKARLRFPGYGELATFLTYGPLLVSSAYYVNAGSFSYSALFVSVPIGISIMLILLSNNIRDITADRRAGLITLANALGKKKALFVFISFLMLMYASAILLSFMHIISYWALLLLLSAPYAWHIARIHMKGIPPNSAALVSNLAFIFGILLSIGIAL